MEVRTQRAKRKNPDDPSDTGRHMVEYNVINTFKFHSLGDHTEYIRRSGPTDNTTTQIVTHERSGTSPLARAATGERVVPMSPSDHYRISRSQRNPMPLREWTAQNESDPAVKGFIPHLYEHLAARLIGGDMFTEPDEFTPEQLDGVQILDDKMYPHNLLRLNYTTYDLRREQDCISPHKQADIMVLA
ncbi:hypothetical protein L226DRAFT_468941, partial [Lentinus tigrinus ALCF2SS1-7]|uniref:uncharacterized protein n=1 Tax=Lentinus tigrinus ALCF2SS1-7 TaxID=1328758 RepID=UPI001165E046